MPLSPPPHAYAQPQAYAHPHAYTHASKICIYIYISPMHLRIHLNTNIYMYYIVSEYRGSRLPQLMKKKSKAPSPLMGRLLHLIQPLPRSAMVMLTEDERLIYPLKRTRTSWEKQIGGVSRLLISVQSHLSQLRKCSQGILRMLAHLS